MYRVVFAAASLATLAMARTDLVGCTSTDVSSPAGASLAWYVPGTGELCDFLDCGGGAGAPRYDVPGCPMYTGTASYSPSYMPGWGSATAAPAAASSAWAAHSSGAWGDHSSTWAETTAMPTGYSHSSSWAESSSSWSSSESPESSWSSSSSSWSTSMVAPVLTTGYSTPTMSSNGTMASATPSAPLQQVGSAGNTRVWFGGAAIAVFAAAVVAL
ncbi:uncharacterized protein MYCFIDRAFT_212158 [Pseudocercospora fijiensis CIRAD86]|uniref:Uncharacterized protein n=1 Tax=Pseudocercospora fijiensis (strain CIRAD86) TaxID=383855 RepID=M2ZJC7_PSEFD|nr:uncharacterized protein MYCFIDRAFT_212158 [Pseudocercospora fijiensis CIRAD86]EME79194.1 hypothetical protein MYCFIDRAFT_212158 [Pseudocercospora fijiensis CIRAD86]